MSTDAMMTEYIDAVAMKAPLPALDTHDIDQVSIGADDSKSTTESRDVEMVFSDIPHAVVHGLDMKSPEDILRDAITEEELAVVAQADALRRYSFAELNRNLIEELESKFEEAGSNSEMLRAELGVAVINDARRFACYIIAHMRKTHGYAEVITMLGPALSVAARHDSGDVATLLLQAQAIVDTLSTDGRTPLLVAAEYDSVDVARALLVGYADIEAINADGETPLMIAVANGVDVAAMLIEAGANVDAVDEKFKTPLMHAASSNNESGCEVVNLLLTSGAEARARDQDGLTAVMCAIRASNFDVAHLFARLDDIAPADCVEYLEFAERMRARALSGLMVLVPDTPLVLVRLIADFVA